MGVFDDAKGILTDPEIQGGTLDVIGDMVSGLDGNVLSIGKLIITFRNNPTLIQEKIFWRKYERFLRGIEATEEERAHFCRKLSENGRKEKNAYRLLQVINNAETLEKIDFLVNASRSYAVDFINRTEYFRMCDMITKTLYEDLIFLKENIQKDELYQYDDTVQGLLNVGLMRASVMDATFGDRFVFTPFAKELDRFSLSYNDVNRYPNPIKETRPKGDVIGTDTGRIEWEDITETEK